MGYLWLKKGKWRDRQLIPENWIELATRRFRRDDGSKPSNYGYTFWIMDEWGKVPKDTFMTQGNNANDSYIIPSINLVVVRQGNENGTSEERAIFREKVIEKITKAIPKNSR
jgi:CubicO group peptidase (beta-lactamase class C family)